jgi:hypothetical protein
MLRTIDAFKADSRGACTEAISGSTRMAKCSIAMSFYIFRDAEKIGLYEKLWPQLTKQWRRMLADNLVTFAETEDGSTRSDRHGWSATPIYEMVADIIGVKPTIDGGVEVRPKVGLLPSGTTGTMVSPQGLLEARMDQGKFWL